MFTLLLETAEPVEMQRLLQLLVRRVTWDRKAKRQFSFTIW
jgi:hypothetical protein